MGIRAPLSPVPFCLDDPRGNSRRHLAASRAAGLYRARTLMAPLRPSRLHQCRIPPSRRCRVTIPIANPTGYRGDLVVRFLTCDPSRTRASPRHAASVLRHDTSLWRPAGLPDARTPSGATSSAPTAVPRHARLTRLDGVQPDAGMPARKNAFCLSKKLRFACHVI